MSISLHWLADAREDRGLRLSAGEGEWRYRSYAELALEVRRTAHFLWCAGARPGDVVAIVLGEPGDFITTFMAALAAGMTPSPLAPPPSFRNTGRYLDHLAAVLRAARPTVICTDSTHRSTVSAGATIAGAAAQVLDVADAADYPADSPADEALAAGLRREPGDPALLQFTSGSTGAPKGVRVSWANLTSNVNAIRDWLRWSEQDVFASWLPLHHDMGLVGAMITSVVSGTDLWLTTPRQFVRDPIRWLECFGVHGATLTTAPSFGYAHVARRVSPEQLAGMDFSAWRVAILGAERIDPVAVARFQGLLGPRGFDPAALIGAYGLAETTLVAAGARAGGGSRLVRVRSTALAAGDPVAITARGTLGTDAVGGAGWLTGCGPAAPGMTLTVVDEQGAELPDGVYGEIRLAGTSLAAGYRTEGGDQPFAARNADNATPALDTGDAGFTLDGDVYIVGRIGDAMKVRGSSVHAEDVEAELATISLTDKADVSSQPSCAVAFGVLDSVDTALVFVEGDAPDEWFTQAAQRVRIATSNAAHIVVLQGKRGSIARTSSGKPQRRPLWQQISEGEEGDQWSVVLELPQGESAQSPVGAS